MASFPIPPFRPLFSTWGRAGPPRSKVIGVRALPLFYMESFGRMIAQHHESEDAPTGEPVDSAFPSAVIDVIVDPPHVGCSGEAGLNATALKTDHPLLYAFDDLASALDSAAPATRLHEHLDEEVVLALIDGRAPARSVAIIDAAGPAAVDIGGFLASVLLVAIERADTLQPVAPTWPPAPLSSRSPAHAAAHDLWHHYIAARSLNEADQTSLLQLSAGYAGCLIIHRTIGGATSLARIAGAERGRVEKCALAVGRELILHSTLRKLVTFDGILTILDSNTNSNKHAQPATFAIFDDFSDE